MLSEELGALASLRLLLPLSAVSGAFSLANSLLALQVGIFFCPLLSCSISVSVMDLCYNGLAFVSCLHWILSSVEVEIKSYLPVS